MSDAACNVTATETYQRGLPGKRYELGDERLTLSELARRAGTFPGTMAHRLRRMTPAEAVEARGKSTKPAPKKGPFAINGETLTVGQMAKRAGVTSAAMSRRLEVMSPEAALAMPRREAHKEIAPETLFDRLTVVRRGPAGSRGQPRYYVRCSCSPDRDPHLVSAAKLLRGTTISCGCVKAERTRQSVFARSKDLTGREFADGLVKVVRLSGNIRMVPEGKQKRHKRRLWVCMCACGETFETTSDLLLKGDVTSCGCGTARKIALSAARKARRGTPRAPGAVRRQSKPAQRQAPAQLELRIEPEPQPASKPVPVCPPAPATKHVHVRLEAKSFREITREMEADLIRRSQAGDRVATETLLVAHDAFLRSVAGKWGHHGLGAEFDDILQEARIAFLRSLKSADPAKGSLITYAGTLATHKARRTVECDSRTIRVPVHIQQAARRAARRGATTAAEIRDATGHTETAEEVATFMRTKGRSMSLDAPIGDESGDTWLDRWADDSATPEAIATEADRLEKLSGLIKSAMVGLSAREIEVIRCRYELEETLDQVGKRFNVTRERIRQIEAKVKSRLKVRLGAAARELEAA